MESEAPPMELQVQGLMATEQDFEKLAKKPRS
jgi:hypothetical protein